MCKPDASNETNMEKTAVDTRPDANGEMGSISGAKQRLDVPKPDYCRYQPIGNLRNSDFT